MSLNTHPSVAPGSARASDPATAGNLLSNCLAEYLQTQLTAIGEGRDEVQRDEPAAIADIVIAARRARSALAAHHNAADHHVELRRLIDELRWFGFGLAASPDLDAQSRRIGAALDTLRPRYVRGPVRDRMAAYFDARIRPARLDGLGLLGSSRCTTLLDDLTTEVETLRDGASGWARTDRIEVLLGELATRVRVRLHAVETTTGEDEHDAAVHAVRKAARRMRYFLESVRPVDPEHCDRVLTDLVAVQDVLGEYHDAVVARRHLLQLCREAENAGESSFTYGLLHQREAEVMVRAGHRLPGLCHTALRDVHLVSEAATGRRQQAR